VEEVEGNDEEMIEAGLTVSDQQPTVVVEEVEDDGDEEKLETEQTAGSVQFPVPAITITVPPNSDDTEREDQGGKDSHQQPGASASSENAQHSHVDGEQTAFDEWMSKVIG
jgi:hypothetical protein